MASTLTIHMSGDAAFPDLLGRENDIIHIGEGAQLHITALDGGMVGGRASIMLRIDLPDGKVVLAETSMRNFLIAARAFSAKWNEDGQPINR